jgi:transmembrane sensor
MDYKNFNVLDFISDENFQNWVIHPNENSNDFWNTWLMKNPEKSRTVDEARSVLLNIRFKEDFPDNEDVQSALQKLLLTIQARNEGDSERRIHSLGNKLRKIAAVFIGLIIISGSLFYYNWRFAKITQSTQYGEIKTIILPDSSKVILNSHSTITYLKHWFKHHAREVTLEGEGFFEVNHLNKDTDKILPNERFFVHGKDVTIEVLGTAFDVRQRRGETEVVLQRGKIKLSVQDISKSKIIMTPGEIFTYDPTGKKMVLAKAVPENYSAWKEKKLVLNDPTLEQIVNYLEDNYGKKIIIEDTSLKERKIEGPILLNNLDDALFIISTVLNTDIYKKGNLLLIRARKTPE